MKIKNDYLTLIRNALALALFSGVVFGAAGAEIKGLRFYPMQLNYIAAENKGGLTLNVMNNTAQVYLLKASVSAMDPDTGREGKAGAPVPPFVILPPLTRLDASGQYAFRVRQAGGALPQDRESACLVTVTAIPGVSEATRPPLRPASSSGAEGASAGSGVPAKGAALQIALRMHIRLFYRPAGVPARDNKLVASRLIFRAGARSLSVENPTPYFVHFASLTVAGKKIKDEGLQGYIPPESHRLFSVDTPVHGAVEWVFTGDKETHRAVISG